MFQTKFYEELINNYINYITPPAQHQGLAKIGGPISQYLADQSNNLINMTGNQTNHIIDFDISSAFPTLCHNLFNNDSQFIQTLNVIKEKKARNIYIATNLKGPLLKQINQMCKLIILGIIFDTSNKIELENILVLELKKDGALISCPSETVDRLKNLSTSNNLFTKFIKIHNFNFHFDEYSKYIRSNRTTFLLNSNLEDITIKGHYKYVPIKLKQIMIQILINNLENINKINHIYSTRVFKILQKNNISEMLTDYYLCDKKKVIDYTGQYVRLQNNTKVNPNLYKQFFLYPLLISNQLE